MFCKHSGKRKNIALEQSNGLDLRRIRMLGNCVRQYKACGEVSRNGADNLLSRKELIIIASLACLLKQKAFVETIEGTRVITDDHSIKTYKRGIRKFCEYEKGFGHTRYSNLDDYKKVLKLEGKEAKDEIQAYSDYLVDQKYSPWTIHTYLAPVCKALEVSMSNVKHPKRSCDKIKRGRNPKANKQGHIEEEKEKYKRSVDLNMALGIRRDELGNLRGRNLKHDEHGYLCVEVENGKGGKYQLQRILPQYVATVIRIFEGIGLDEKVFTQEELANHINYHKMRAKLAKESYQYYARKLYEDPSYRTKLKKELYDRYMKYNPENGADAWSRKFKRFQKTIENPNPYYLRRTPRKMAEILGMSIKYNRLSILATSILVLSHWRLDVAVANYLLQ